MGDPVQNKFRMVERGYFEWRDRNDTDISSTILRSDDDCLITLTRGEHTYELTVTLDGRVGVRRNGQKMAGFTLENLLDIDALLYSMSFPLLQS
jgi:hypothetical protein